MSDFSLVGGIGIMGFISPMNTNDTYAVIDSLYGIDGLRNVNSIEELNSISFERRRAGMIVGVFGGESYYKLKNIEWVGDITDWEELDLTKQIYVDKEKPTGDINGTNSNFILSKIPIPNSEHIYLNGLLQDVDEDYTINNSTITFFMAPLTGMKIRCSYRTI
jgi:hypothetical protein